jgi:membrane AbrB-like protein
MTGRASAAVRVLIACGLGLAGAMLGMAVGLPAPALLGSTLLVGAATLVRVPLVVPDGLRNLAFAAIGCSLGSGITPHFLSDLARWPASLALLAVAVVTIMAVSTLILAKGFGQAPEDAVLATAPGALSYALALAVSRGRDVQSIMVFQTLRLMAITLTLPPVLQLVSEPGQFWSGLTAADVPYAVALPTLAVAFAAGTLAAARGMQAAHLLAGMFASGGLHMAGIVEGRFPPLLMFCGFAVTGAVIGARFGGVTLGDLRRLAGASATVISASVAISALFALAAARAVDIPVGQAWVAYAPGGVEAMAAMGLALGYDPAFVATHLLLRILLVIAVLPLFFARVRSRT